MKSKLKLLATLLAAIGYLCYNKPESNTNATGSILNAGMMMPSPADTAVWYFNPGDTLLPDDDYFFLNNAKDTFIITDAKGFNLYMDKIETDYNAGKLDKTDTTTFKQYCRIK